MSQNITNYIGKISETIKDIESSISTINIGNIGENEDSLVYKETYEKIKSLNDNTQNIISFLFDSVLIGEYLDKDIDKQLKQIRNNLTYTHQLEKEILPNEDKYKTILAFINSLKDKTNEIQGVIKHYLLFIEDVKTIVSNPEKDEIFILLKNKYQSNNDSEVLKLFTLNLFLCFSDILFTEKQDCYQDITFIKRNLPKEEDTSSNLISENQVGKLKSQVEKMNKKASFLLFKWCKRAELSGFSMLKEDKINEYKSEISAFGEDWESLVTYIENHHYKEDEKHLFVEKIKESYIKIEDKELKNFTCQDIYSYIKYHKEIDKKIDKLDEIISILDKRRFCTTDNYDKNIRTIIYNYARNNRFSLFTETCDNREDLQKEYNKIDNKDNRNYFLQYKFIDKSIELLNAELSEKNENITIDQIEEIEKYLKEIEPEYETYKTNIEWILEHIYFIYRVSFDECIIDDIFIYSSFLLPLDNRKSKDGFEKISDGFRNLKNQLPLLRKMSLFKDELLQFDEKIEKHDTKTIELMGLFSAIIAFVMGSIPTFQYLKNIFDVGIFFIVFATSLISFLLVLLFITRRIKVNKEQKWWESPIVYFLFFYIAMIIIAYVLSCFNPKDNERKTTTLQQTEKTIIEEKITSNKTVDTLKQSKITKKHTTSTKDSLK
jgi:hypothetical protein